MGPLNTYEYSMDAYSDEGYNDIMRSSGMSWYCSEEFDETRLTSAFSDMGVTDLSDEGRLSRALQSWMPDYVITNIEPMEKPPREPVFTGKLGKDRERIAKINISGSKRVPSAAKQKRTTHDNKNVKQVKDKRRNSASKQIRFPKKCSKTTTTDVNSNNDQGRLQRSSSYDSLSTHYSSLFEISSWDNTSETSVNTSRRKKRGRSRMEQRSPEASPQQFQSKWVELANKRLGAFDKFMRLQNAMQIDTFGTHSGQFESEAFELMDPDERKLIFACGKHNGIRLVKGMKKSGSTTTLNIKPPTHQKQIKLRVLSAGHKPLSRGFNLEEARQQLARERLAAMRLKQNKSSGRNRRISSRMSMRSEISSNISCPTPPSMRSLSPSTQDSKPETMWKGDKEILEMDLRRGLSSRVQTRIKTTTSALQRVTGYGENNTFHQSVGRCDDFPQFIDDDYGLRPKIVQKMRISPFLSNVIREDIKVRMGRPRYHEIKVKDLEWWNGGQKLNRAHRNLKVFNWLHSLREDDFENIQDIDIIDKPPESDDSVAIMHVESADEPDIKPLYLTNFFK